MESPKNYFKTTPYTMPVNVINAFLAPQRYQERDKEVVTLLLYLTMIKQLLFTDRN